MRTYEIAIEVRYTERVTVEVPEGTDSAELLRIGVEKAGLQNLPEHATSLYYAHDTTPKPKTDKQRFNDAFRELRKLGYDARQGLTPMDDSIDVYTMRDDSEWAFFKGRLQGMVPINWCYDNLTDGELAFKTRVIRQAFEKQGFDVQWDGTTFQAFQIRGGK